MICFLRFVGTLSNFISLQTTSGLEAEQSEDYRSGARERRPLGETDTMFATRAGNVCEFHMRN